MVIYRRSKRRPSNLYGSRATLTDNISLDSQPIPKRGANSQEKPSGSMSTIDLRPTDNSQIVNNPLAYKFAANILSVRDSRPKTVSLDQVSQQMSKGPSVNELANNISLEHDTAHTIFGNSRSEALETNTFSSDQFTSNQKPISEHMTANDR